MRDLIRIIQGLLTGFVLDYVGYSYKTSVYWIVVIIICLQWIKEGLTEASLLK